jgi:hypothetical protein
VAAPYVIQAITSDVSGPMAPGQRVSITLQCTATGVGDASQAVVGARVWALPEERVVFATNATAHNITLPPAGPFKLEITLDMNVGPGLYRLQSVVWQRSGGAEWQRGGAVVVRVEENLRAFGSTYLNPQVRLLPD